jgi:hypothetical protein
LRVNKKKYFFQHRMRAIACILEKCSKIFYHALIKEAFRMTSKLSIYKFFIFVYSIVVCSTLKTDLQNIGKQSVVKITTSEGRSNPNHLYIKDLIV